MYVITFLYTQSSQQLFLDVAHSLFYYCPNPPEMIDLDLAKSLIDPLIPMGDLVIRQKHILVIYVGVKCNDELQM